MTKFTVIVPTRERPDTLFHCLRSIMAQDYENFEVLISDNFSQDNTKDVVDSFSDKRIKYINTGKRISMSHNWEFALNHVKEGWVCFLGDDDGLFPWALKTIDEAIKKHQVEAISSNFASFTWPEHFDSQPQGKLSIPLTEGFCLKNSKTELNRALAGNISYRELPWLYHGGAASIDLLNRLRNKNGQFFCSQIPDLYSAVALSLATDQYLSINTPIAINGGSKHSTGTSCMQSKSGKEAQAFMQFQSEGNIPFHKDLILGKSLQIILFECYLQSMHIHQDSLGLKLHPFLQENVKLAELKKQDHIVKEFHDVARKNGFHLEKNSFNEKFIMKLKRLSNVFNLSSQNITFDPRKMDIANVYDASIASAYLYKFIKNQLTGSKLRKIVKCKALETMIKPQS
jgi:glycosyltransferase involved in cell wall biosynthesis